MRHSYRTPEERDLVDINLLARHWRRLHRSEDQPLFARELRRLTYQKWEQEFKDQKVLHTMPDGTVVTLGMLERLIKAEPVDRLQAEFDRFSPASGGIIAEEFISPFTKEDKKTHTPGKPVEGEEQL